MTNVNERALMSGVTAQDEWEMISRILEKRIGDRAFGAWFHLAKVEENQTSGNCICLSFPTPFTAVFVRKHYLPKLQELWIEFRGEAVEIIVTARSRSVGAVSDTGLKLSRPKSMVNKVKLDVICSRPPVIVDVPPADVPQVDEVSEKFDLSTVFGDKSPQQCMEIEIEVDSILERYNGRISAELCIGYISVGYGRGTYEIISSRQLVELLEPRKIAIFLTSELVPLAAETVARSFRRRKADVMYANKMVRERRERDPDFAARLNFHVRYLIDRREAFLQKRRQNR